MQLNKSKYYSNQFDRHYLLLALLISQLNGCAFAPWDKHSDKNITPEAQVAEAKQKAAKDPDGTVSRKNLIVTNELAVTKLFAEAEQARSKGMYENANSIYDRVLEILPDNPSAINEKNKVNRELAQSKKLAKAAELIESNKLEEAKDVIHEVIIENPLHEQALKLQQQINDKSAPLNSKPLQLKVQFDKPVTLELRDVNIKISFEALSRAT